MVFVAFAEERRQVLKFEAALCLKKGMESGKIYRVSAQVGLGVLYLSAGIHCCFYGRLVQPYKQIPDIELRLCTLDQEHLAHGIQLFNTLLYLS